MDYRTILYHVKDRILTLTLNRPDKLNSFTIEMSHELIHAYQRASEDDLVSVIIVTGAGRAFCAGMDLNIDGNVFGLNEELKPTIEDMRERSEDEEIIRGVRDAGGRVVLAMYECKKTNYRRNKWSCRGNWSNHDMCNGYKISFTES